MNNDSIKIKNNEVGDFYQLDLPDNRVYSIFTKSGHYRGGKIYSKDKFFTILSGKVEVTIFDGKEDIKSIYSTGSVIKIDKNIPNVFYFPEDCEMLEWFPKDTETEKYERYYKLKG